MTPFISVGCVTYINHVINIVINSPLNKVVEHQLGLVHIEFSCSQESQKIVVIVHGMVNDMIVFKVLSKLLQRLLLFLVLVSHESIN